MVALLDGAEREQAPPASRSVEPSYLGVRVIDPVAMMAIMPATIRPLTPADTAAVVEFSLRAWAPVFESFRTVLGERVYRLVYPDWPTTQAQAVEAVCQDDAAAVWVAELHGRPVGYVAAQTDSSVAGP